MKNNYEGYLDFFNGKKELLEKEYSSLKNWVNIFMLGVSPEAFYKVMEKDYREGNISSISWEGISNACKTQEGLYNFCLCANFGGLILRLKNALKENYTPQKWNYSKFASYESGEAFRQKSIAELQKDINTLSGYAKDSLFLSDGAKNQYELLNNYIAVSINFINSLYNYKDTEANRYRLYANALAYFVALSSASADNFGHGYYETFVRGINENYIYAKDIPGVKKSYETFVYPGFKALTDLRYDTMLDNESYNLTLIAQKIVDTKLLPDSINNYDAANKIASYYEDRRVSSEKEAINLYFEELASEKERQAKEAAANELRRQILEVSKMIHQHIEQQSLFTRQIAQTIEDSREMMINEHNKLVDEHNKLVDEHNELVDKHKELERKVKDGK